MNKYSNGDEAENLVDDFLHSKLKRPYTIINRTKDSSENNERQVVVIDGEKLILPDITVFKDKNLKEIELRVEVKSFKKLPTKESPNRNLPLFPIKVRQLEEYTFLRARDEIDINIVFVIGKENKDLYWCNIDDVTGRLDFLISEWDGEISCWYNINDMNSKFDNF